MGRRPRKPTREGYINSLRLHGYTIEGDLVYLNTVYGKWVQRIVEDQTGFFLETVEYPVPRYEELEG